MSACEGFPAQPAIGLALSSGGAKALAHIGVIQVLEEHGIRISAIAGCSMGAYVGAVWACGHDGQFMESLAREVESRWGLLRLIDPALPPRRGFLRGSRIRDRLRQTVGDTHFAGLARPLRVVATNLFTLERTVISDGEIARAVQASSAIPGVCEPVQIGDQWFVDGGISDPLPVDVLRGMGVQHVIAVNTIPTPAYLKCRDEMSREQKPFERGVLPALRGLLNRHLNYFAPGNILDVMMRSVNAAQMRLAAQSCREADLVLRPLSMDGRWHDFKHPGKYIALGRRVAEENLGAILDLAQRTAHEPQSNNTLAVAA
jgi:NTE family protein